MGQGNFVEKEMDPLNNNFPQNRNHAGRLLGAKLSAFKNSGAVVVGVPRGGALVAAALSEELQLPFDVMPCRRIKHPADGTQSIGSVSAREIVLSSVTHDLPQDYIGHQIVMIRSSVQADDRFYHAAMPSLSFAGKTVILVDESLRTVNSILACVVSIKKQKASKVIVAVSVATDEAVAAMSRLADEVVFLNLEHDPRQAWFPEFTAPGPSDVRELLAKRRRGEMVVME